MVETPPVPVYMSMQEGCASNEERPTLNDNYVVHHADGSWEIDVPRLFTDVFQGYDSLTGAALRHAVMNLGRIATQRLYNNCLDKAMKMQLMLKSFDSKKRVVYRLNVPTQPAAVSHQTPSEPQQQALWKNGDAF